MKYRIELEICVVGLPSITEIIQQQIATYFMNQHSSTIKKYYSPLIGAALVAASLFQFSMPVFAAGTAAGTTLRNTATGSYEDETGNTYTIESNTVDVTVAKVAGVTNQPTGINDADGGNVLTGDTISFEFTITNVGNDSSNIFIPAAGDIATRGLNSDAGDLTVEVSQINPANNPAFVARPNDGIIENVPTNGQIIVRVTGTVSATAAGAPIEVLLGNTGPNTDPNAPVAATQNQPDTDGGETGGEANDVRTETATTPQVAGAPVDGQREASALQQVFLGSNPLAMTRIEKVRGAVQDGGDTDLSNDIISYSLELEVLNTTPNSLFIPGDLKGRDYTAPNTGSFNGLGGDLTDLILVSDAIPQNAAFVAGSANTPANWTPVYTDDDPTTVLPDNATWVTNPGSLTDPITRVGWVYNARATNQGGNGPITPGTAIPTFNFDVVTSGLNAGTGGTVANIAQVFGSTVGSNTNVFDESGDQDPSNFNGPNPGPNEDDPQSTGIADPATQGVDSENNNNANSTDPASPGGEDNVITIGAPGQLLNGPVGQPAATGNVFGGDPDNDHDFQNAGVDNFPANAKHDAGTTFDPNVVSFSNTLSNPGDTDLTNVLLQPINPEFDPNFTGNATDADLPSGTTVTLRLGGQNATYTYTTTTNTVNGNDVTTGRFNLTSGQPITIPTLSQNTDLAYTVDVDLPANTGLSTDTDINGGFPVPVIAFIDTVSDGTPDPATENYNITVDQVYTGYVKVTKQVRVLQPDGNVRANMDFNNDNADKEPLPGDTLEYRVIYRNISEPQVGTGNNGILDGVDVTIDEDGTLDAIDDGIINASGNNWGLDSNTDGDLDTVNVQNSATDSNGGTITFFTGASSTTTPLGTGMSPSGTVDPGDTVTGYRSTVDRLAPTGAEVPARVNVYNPNEGDSAFTFRRVVDEFDGLPEEGLDSN